ncbi:YTH domain-containing protein ECT4-like isoform X1 [Zingiber officinale]|uniref:YTH domain-containing protein ECT4-like isoform X1 n=1 Tax=Zingiber officinale TaxID=94328 RepID=UPI001C4D9432|nr:YTH domain-containing protein ECT4-like isoform X1 [Zingiber officinale]XP_042435031.1 YTH domain-containing protein ECT4-like isoform X1 [Zingiber officinale]
MDRDDHAEYISGYHVKPGQEIPSELDSLSQPKGDLSSHLQHTGPVEQLSRTGSPGAITTMIGSSVSLLRSTGPKSTKGNNRGDLADSANILNLKPNSSSRCNFSGEANRHVHKAQNLTSRSQSIEAIRGHYNSQTITSISHERQVGLLNKQNHTKPIGTKETVFGYQKFGRSSNYGSYRNTRDSSENVWGPRANRDTYKRSFGSTNGKLYANQLVCRNKYNKPDFQSKHDKAKFFMIKSFNEDDIHKSIKYNVWTSTPLGNEKLDAAFWDAQGLMEKGSKCPIFLFFSVNSSGQFVGLAEMLGPVDFNKNMDFWQQEKWKGFLPLKWHIVKDIPNQMFQNITLENNGNHPVVFSKDTQEIGLPQGLQMLQIFKNYIPRTMLLDDFEFYEQREKSLQAIRRRRSARMNSDREFYGNSNHVKHVEEAASNLNVTGKSRNRFDLPSPSNGRRFGS